MVSYFPQLALVYELSQIKPFKTVGVYPLVTLEINLVGGSQHFFKKEINRLEKNTT